MEIKSFDQHCGSIYSRPIFKFQAKVSHFFLHVFLVVLCIFFVIFKVKGQDSTTDLVLIGVRHVSNPFYNGDSLMKVVASLKPDIVLIEYDSTSYSFKTGRFRPLPNWSMSLRKAGAQSKLSPDDEMIQKFHREFPSVLLKPIDVAFNGSEKDKYVDNYIKLEEEFADAMFKAFEENEMSEYRAQVHLARRRLISFFSERMKGPLQGFNDDSITVAIRQGQELQTIHFKALVDSVPSLKGFSSRIYNWIEMAEYRNRVMCQQILRFIKEYKGKRIVVVTGVLHRYYQLDDFAPKREQLNLRILDINGNEMNIPPNISPWIKN